MSHTADPLKDAGLLQRVSYGKYIRQKLPILQYSIFQVRLSKSLPKST